MTLFPVGLFVAITAIFASIRHLNQPLGSYYDFVAFTVVLGGTTAVALIILPWDARREIVRAMASLIYKKRTNRRFLLESAMSLVQNPNSPDIRVELPELSKRILKEGSELIQLGIPVERIEAILVERVMQSGKRIRKVGTGFKNLAKYPPAFGLMGTVLGLVNLMRGISSGLSAQQTGLEMAVALVATMYGLLMANLVVNPIGEMIIKRATEEEECADIALQAVVLAAAGRSALEAQEMLNSYVDQAHRIDIIRGVVDDPSSAEAA